MQAFINRKWLGIVMLASCTGILATGSGAQAQLYNPSTLAAYRQQQAIAMQNEQAAMTYLQQAENALRQQQRLALQLGLTPVTRPQMPQRRDVRGAGFQPARQVENLPHPSSGPAAQQLPGQPGYPMATPRPPVASAPVAQQLPSQPGYPALPVTPYRGYPAYTVPGWMMSPPPGFYQPAYPRYPANVWNGYPMYPRPFFAR